MSRLTIVSLLVALPSLACSSYRSDDGDSGAQTLGEIDTDAEGQDEVVDTEGDTSSGEKLDMGAPTDNPGGGGDGTGCKKIDLLFVIDNSGSMATEQTNLVAAFPEFVAAIQDVLPDATDLHVGVTKTDDLGIDPNSALSDAPPFAADPCVNQLGGLIDRATPVDGNSGYGEPCGFTSGERYMINGPALADEFACAATLGVHGSGLEKHVDAILGALDPADACSAGFVRDDALLVIVVITDEDDDWSAPDNLSTAERVAQWSAAIKAVEGDIETNVVFTLISGGSPPWGTCPPFDIMDPDTAKESDVLTALANTFTNAFEADVCAPGYVDVFAAAIGVIETACEDFEPIG